MIVADVSRPTAARRQPSASAALGVARSRSCLGCAPGREYPLLPRLRNGPRAPVVASAAPRAARPRCCLGRTPGPARPRCCIGCARERALALASAAPRAVRPPLASAALGAPRAPPLTLAPGSSGRRSYNPGPIAGGPASSPAQHSSIPVRSCRAPGCCSSLLPSAQRNSGPPRLRAAPPAPARPR